MEEQEIQGKTGLHRKFKTSLMHTAPKDILMALEDIIGIPLEGFIIYVVLLYMKMSTD